MYFINRKAELNSFKSNYEKYRENNISQVYIIEAWNRKIRIYQRSLKFFFAFSSRYFSNK